jgi:hypothetical protein
MPSWPGWVGLLIASLRDEEQRSTKDGTYRMVLTLPVNSTLSPAQRSAIENYIADAMELCDLSPHASSEFEKAMLVIVTDLMLGPLPSSQQTEASAEACGKAYMAALDDVPFWAAAEAVRLWYKGECGSNERGELYDYRWRPAPADLRRIALAVRWRLLGATKDLRRLLDAETRVEYSEEHRNRMRDKLKSLGLASE